MPLASLRGGLLAHADWGPRLPFSSGYDLDRPEFEEWSFNEPAQRTPEEYPAYAGAKYIEPCLKATFADGVRDMVLQFEDATMTGPGA